MYCLQKPHATEQAYYIPDATVLLGLGAGINAGSIWNWGLLKQERKAWANWRKRGSAHIMGVGIVVLQGAETVSATFLYSVGRYACNLPGYSVGRYACNLPGCLPILGEEC